MSFRYWAYIHKEDRQIHIKMESLLITQEMTVTFSGIVSVPLVNDLIHATLEYQTGNSFMLAVSKDHFIPDASGAVSPTGEAYFRDYFIEQGYRKHNNRWLTPEEVELLPKENRFTRLSMDL